ncbi:MAG: hypothetical protein A2898_02050 [Candidatus Kerfeldbacteria bacterium RIFCSPLOWO2_01_FULL_48_11]|uniref:Nucleotidyl transferase AbiEii/AbiGii toxin family protein n=1 Tax=Candidatus Kerfeldbacteria bacterium RIFCSPLOWO2_01_FULL_48_11 TaxID=1798543 RepID=A0A1G2B728_9BACT|nr:MAG: hypothetical protein UY34_C0037G0010 [Parcubacteria group bacterium GW2011_GWA2_48_9]OGY84027.1 MAG: hypothetical protein A2898_02050 [Candidatus Kerfeldbacteria bacterium RIFCSPLOWO2_01_FULL_48_11]
MLSLESLREFTKKYQTKETNVLREYVQHLFLSSLYRFPGSERLLFKGGTALRIIYQSPRFSEDLDFTGQNIYAASTIDALFISAVAEVEKSGIHIELKEAKPTTGGYLGIIRYELYDFTEDMKFEVSLRRGTAANKEVSSITNDYHPSYPLFHLAPSEIVRGKMAALLDRQKPRDYYDLYFILRHPELSHYVDKKLLPRVKESVLKSRINFKKELTVLLPVSHHLLLKEFSRVLSTEILKYL